MKHHVGLHIVKFQAHSWKPSAVNLEDLETASGERQDPSNYVRTAGFTLLRQRLKPVGKQESLNNRYVHVILTIRGEEC